MRPAHVSLDAELVTGEPVVDRYTCRWGSPPRGRGEVKVTHCVYSTQERFDGIVLPQDRVYTKCLLIIFVSF